MRFKVVFEDLRRVFRNNPDVLFLVEQVENQIWDCRKQLADMVFADKRDVRRISMTTRAALRRWAAVD